MGGKVGVLCQTSRCLFVGYCCFLRGSSLFRLIVEVQSAIFFVKSLSVKSGLLKNKKAKVQSFR